MQLVGEGLCSGRDHSFVAMLRAGSALPWGSPQRELIPDRCRLPQWYTPNFRPHLPDLRLPSDPQVRRQSQTQNCVLQFSSQHRYIVDCRAQIEAYICRDLIVARSSCVQFFTCITNKILFYAFNCITCFRINRIIDFNIIP